MNASSVVNSLTTSSSPATSPTSSKYKGLFGNITVSVNETVTTIMIIIITFYGMLYISQVRSIFTCQQNAVNNSHPLYKLIFAFGIFYFIAVVVSNSEIDIPPIVKIFNTIIYFLIFIVFNRLDYRLAVTVLGLVFFVYFLSLNKQYYFNLDPTTNAVSVKYTSKTTPSTTSSSSTSTFSSKSDPLLPSSFNHFSSTPTSASSSSSTSSSSTSSSSSSTSSSSTTSSSSSTTSSSTSSLSSVYEYWIFSNFPIKIRLLKVEQIQYYYLNYLTYFTIVIILMLVMIGFINHLGLLKYVYKNKLNLYNLIVVDPSCAKLKYQYTFYQYVLLAINYNYYINKLKPLKSVKPFIRKQKRRRNIK